MHGYILVRLSLDLATGKWGFGSAKPYALFSLGDFWSDILTRVNEVVVENPTVFLSVSVFIWLLVNILNGGLASFRQPIEPESSSE